MYTKSYYTHNVNIAALTRNRCESNNQAPKESIEKSSLLKIFIVSFFVFLFSFISLVLNAKTVKIAKDKMHIYLIAGRVFDLNSDWQFKPALLTKLVQGAPLQIDFSANFLFNQKFTFGAAYRLNAAVTGLVGFQVNEAWQIGYSYDTETSKLSNYNSGSHEIFLRFELFSKYNKIVSPRFF